MYFSVEFIMYVEFNFNIYNLICICITICFIIKKYLKVIGAFLFVLVSKLNQTDYKASENFASILTTFRDGEIE